MQVSREPISIQTIPFKDGKIRFKERYIHYIDEVVSLHNNSNNQSLIKLPNADESMIIYIPSAKFLRNYLPLVEFLAQQLINTKSKLKILLLESVFEAMDYNSMLHNADTQNQSFVNASERQRIKKLCSSHEIISAFADLSITLERDEHLYDTFLTQKMSIPFKAMHQLIHVRDYFLRENIQVKILHEFAQEENNKFDSILFEKSEASSLCSSKGWIQDLFENKFVTEFHIELMQELVLSCQEQQKQRTLREATESAIHYSEVEIQNGIKQQYFHKAKYEIPKHSKEPQVKLKLNKETYKLEPSHIKAIQGDTVIIKLLSKETAIIIHNPTLSSQRRNFVCTLIPYDERLAVPYDTRIPKIRLQHQRKLTKSPLRVLVHVDRWPEDSVYPTGHLLKVIGNAEDLETELQCLLHEFELEKRMESFSSQALACLPLSDKLEIPNDELKSRRDLRDLNIFSIDPIGCQDIDDTMHIKKLSKNRIEVGVHIADVTYFVQKDSALDKEASLLGNTLYLIDRRYDMLPSKLSSNLCSLHSNVDRFAMSVIWVLSNDLKVESVWFGRSLIRNQHAMTYEQAHALLHDVEPDNGQNVPALTAGGFIPYDNRAELKKDLVLLRQLARKLKQKRENYDNTSSSSSTAIDFHSQEIQFKLDQDSKKPIQLIYEKEEEHEIHDVVAEMMIYANTTVAKQVYDVFPNIALLRRHDAPLKQNLHDLEYVINTISTAVGNDEEQGRISAMNLNQHLAQQATNEESINSLLSNIAIRSMTEAKYICSGDSNQTGKYNHYGLGLEFYTHFTSPIRRYADVIVHRLLLASLEYKEQKEIEMKKKEVTTILPQSKTMSVLNYNENEDSEDFLDFLIGDTATTVSESQEQEVFPTLGTKTKTKKSPSLPDWRTIDFPHDNFEKSEKNTDNAENVTSKVLYEESDHDHDEDLDDDGEDFLDSLIGDAAENVADPLSVPKSSGIHKVIKIEENILGLTHDNKTSFQNVQHVDEEVSDEEDFLEALIGDAADQVASLRLLDTNPQSKSFSDLSAANKAVEDYDEHNSSHADSNSADDNEENSIGEKSAVNVKNSNQRNETTSTPLYTSKEIQTICENINVQNRVTKLCAADCRQLYLNLYFRTHSKLCTAVILSLKTNGVFVYVPELDIKGIVYLFDKYGCFHFDPLLLGLEHDQEFLPPSKGFLPSQRKIIQSSSELSDDNKELQVSVTPTNFSMKPKSVIFRTLDRITVLVSSKDFVDDDYGSAALSRISSPRLYFVKQGKMSDGTESIPTELKFVCKQQIHEDEEKIELNTEKLYDKTVQHDHNESLYKVLCSMNITSYNDSPETNNDFFFKGTISGRFNFNSFKNPNESLKSFTTGETDEHHVPVATTTNPMHNKDKKMTMEQSKRIERQITTRMQRLAAAKRDTRVKKSKKN